MAELAGRSVALTLPNDSIGTYTRRGFGKRLRKKKTKTQTISYFLVIILMFYNLDVLVSVTGVAELAGRPLALTPPNDCIVTYMRRGFGKRLRMKKIKAQTISLLSDFLVIILIL